MRWENETKRIGQCVAHEREAAGLTQLELATGIGCHPSIISKIESGSAALTFRRAAEIAKFLHISLTRLYGSERLAG